MHGTNYHRKMKKIKFLFIFLFAFTTIAYAQMTPNNSYAYTPEVMLVVKAFQSGKTYDDTHKIYIAGTGLRYKTAIIDIENAGDNNVDIDFGQFYLLDDQDNKYEVSAAVQGMKMTFTTKEMVFTLKKGKKKRYVVSFWPAFPKDQKITRMMINGAIVALTDL